MEQYHRTTRPAATDAAPAEAAPAQAPNHLDARVVLQPAIDAMSAHIAVLDPEGTIVTVNERWRRFADENRLRTPDYAVGRSYFDGWLDDAQGGPEPRAVRDAIRAILRGEQDEYRALYPCHGNDQRRWFHLRVTPFVHAGVRYVVAAHANVTPLVEASEALRESEARFRSIADSVPVFIYLLRPDGSAEFINKPLRDYHGLSVEELQGADIGTPVHPDDLPAAAAAFATAFAETRPVSVEQRMRGVNGEYRWFINQAVPRYGPDGEHLGYIGCCLDVHKRKLAERALEASERRYRSIFETTAVAMWETDFTRAKVALDELRASGVADVRGYLRDHPEFVARCAGMITVRDVNDAAVRLAEADSREHLLGKFAEMFLPETFAVFAEELADFVDGRGAWQRETVIRTLRGRQRRVLLTISLPPAAPVEGVLAAVIDVTEQRQLQDALRRSEALNRAVLGSLQELIAVLDGAGRIIAVNNAWGAFARRDGGAQPEMSAGVGDNYLDVVARAAGQGSEQAAVMLRGIRDVLEGRTDAFETEYHYAGAADRWFLTTAVPLRGDGGNGGGGGGGDGGAGGDDPAARASGRGAVIVHTDITDRKEAQNLMQALNARLLRAQEDERRRLAREMHDDVTQRLAVLAIESGRLELQLQSADAAAGASGGSAAAAAHAAAVAKVRHMTEQIVKLSTDVHAISRQLHPSILDDLGLADAVESECHAFADREGIDVALDLAPLPESIPNDVALCLYRVLQEALRNVAKHAETDRVRVRLAPAVPDAREVVLSVVDEGVGFNARRARGGPGLGLASMRERARLVGAELTVRSTPGKGTTVEVRAPLAAAPPAPSTPPPPSPSGEPS